MRKDPSVRGQFPIPGTVGKMAPTNRNANQNFENHGLLLFFYYKGGGEGLGSPGFDVFLTHCD